MKFSFEFWDEYQPSLGGAAVEYGIWPPTNGVQKTTANQREAQKTTANQRDTKKTTANQMDTQKTTANQRDAPKNTAEI